VAIKILETPNFKDIIKTVGATDKELASVATYIIIGISKRTQNGYDADNRTFKGYSADYKQFRKEKGRTTSKVNLTFNNQMLSSMRTKKVHNGTAIVFDNSVENAKADFNHNKMRREFFALDVNQERYIIDTIGDFISKSLNK
tara:strand:- start:1762 stop:2190 length:429 start_codon:yes stop_codon:yes gene_type:complete